jgi:hypothetical protein
LFDGDVNDLCALKKLDELSAIRLSKDLDEVRTIARKSAFLRYIRPLINGRQAQSRDAIYDK